MNEMSNLDAFLALKDLDDEEIVIPAPRHRKLKEGKSFDVRDDKAMEAAKQFNEADVKQDVELEVVDSNADSEKHVQNNSSYVGQRILQCNTCHTNRFVNVEDLEKLPDGNYKVKENTNIGIDNECPHCHSDAVTYTSVGDVAAVSDEASFDNNESSEDAAFDNDMTSTEQEGEPESPAEDTPAENNNEPSGSDNEPGAWDETDAEDDTADMKDTTGDMIDQDDVKEDDTVFPWENDEEPTEAEEKKEKAKKKTVDSLFDDKKNESLNEELAGHDDTANDLFSLIIEPDNIDNITILDAAGEEIYNGEYPDGYAGEDYWMDSEILSWGVLQGHLILNVSNHIDGIMLKDSLRLLDEETDKIDIWDTDADDYVFTGNKEQVVEKYGEYVIDSIEAPERLSVSVDVEHTEPEDEFDGYPMDGSEPTLTSDDREAGQWYESLARKVCEANGLRYYRAGKENTQEYWITESIKHKEDLDVIYEHFVKNIVDESIINEFKRVTGYRTPLDEMMIAEGKELFTEDAPEAPTFNEPEAPAAEPAQEQQPQNDSEEIQALKNAQELSRQNKADIIYGFKVNGKFTAMKTPSICKNAQDLRSKTELVQTLVPNATVCVMYQNNNERVVESFKTRKELAAAILECKNNNKPYKVSKSLFEGYRYDLELIEAKSKEEEEELALYAGEEPEEYTDEIYNERADAWIKTIGTLKAHDVDKWLRSYDFEKNPPADETEQRIWDALKARKAELENGETVKEDVEHDEEHDEDHERSWGPEEDPEENPYKISVDDWSVDRDGNEAIVRAAVSGELNGKMIAIGCEAVTEEVEFDYDDDGNIEYADLNTYMEMPLDNKFFDEEDNEYTDEEACEHWGVDREELNNFVVAATEFASEYMAPRAGENFATSDKASELDYDMKEKHKDDIAWDKADDARNEELKEENEVATRDNFLPAGIHNGLTAELIRITRDIADTIRDSFNYEADLRAIAQDLVSDLEIIRRQEGEEGVNEILAQLSQPYFSTAAIRHRIGSDAFVNASLKGVVPFFPADASRRLSGGSAGRAQIGDRARRYSSSARQLGYRR